MRSTTADDLGQSALIRQFIAAKKKPTVTMLISSPVLSHLFLLDADWSHGSVAYLKNISFNSVGVNRAKAKSKQKTKQKTQTNKKPKPNQPKGPSRKQNQTQLTEPNQPRKKPKSPHYQQNPVLFSPF